MIYSIFGYGKGKTEASIGMTIRAIQNKDKVYYCQFLKDGNSSELVLFRTHFQEYVTTNSTFTKAITLPKNVKEDDIVRCDILLSNIKTVIDNNSFTDYKLIVMDEILPALDMKLVELSDLIDIINKAKSNNIDICMTGRIRSHELRKQIIELSDICSNCYCEKHSYNTHCDKCNQDYKYHYVYCPQCGSKLKVSQPAQKGRDF